jgi:alkaline phosphatase D
MKNFNRLFTVLQLMIVTNTIICNAQKKETQATPLNESFKIAFGSCAHQDKEQPMLQKAVKLNPDLFIYLGDNLYGDTRDMNVLKNKYEKLGSKAEFQELKKSTKILSVWDDHDYGENDKGRHYPFKKESKEIFMNFWEVPQNSERRTHEGIYGSEYVKLGDKTLQIIMLDTRTFRDDLLINEPKNSAYKNDYVPYTKKDSTILGNKQWNWLENELSKKADIRIIASSLQFGHEYNGYESWTNMPHEQAKFVDLIAKTKANGVVFISGDVHWGEISKMKTNNSYPLYDVTSSGITQTWTSTESNKNRIGDVIIQNNIGLIEIFYKDKEPLIKLNLFDKNGIVSNHNFLLSEISFN